MHLPPIPLLAQVAAFPILIGNLSIRQPERKLRLCEAFGKAGWDPLPRTKAFNYPRISSTAIRDDRIDPAHSQNRRNAINDPGSWWGMLQREGISRMKKAPTVFAGIFLLTACVQLPDILETAPVRSGSFAGAQTDMAECVRASLPGGKVERMLNDVRIDVYDAKKTWEYIGVTHYAVSVYNNGRVELRKLPEGELTEEANKRLWVPIENCGAETITS